jgi:hypothetical protein
VRSSFARNVVTWVIVTLIASVLVLVAVALAERREELRQSGAPKVRTETTNGVAPAVGTLRYRAPPDTAGETLPASTPVLFDGAGWSQDRLLRPTLLSPEVPSEHIDSWGSPPL